MKRAIQPTAALEPQHRNLETRHCQRRTRPLAAALCLLAGAMVFSPLTSPAPDGQWRVNAAGEWSSTSSWQPLGAGIIATGATYTATFATSPGAFARPIRLDAPMNPLTIGNIILFPQNVNSYNLQYYNTTPFPVIMDNGANLAKVRSPATAHINFCSVELTGAANGIALVDGGGVLVLQASNSWTGSTYITSSDAGAGAGVLRIANTNAIPHGPGKGNVYLNGPDLPLEPNGGVLDLNGYSITINGLGAGTNGGKVINSAASSTTATLTVGETDATSTFDGAFADGTSGGKVALTKIGTGTLTLTSLGGEHTFSGPTTITGGTLALTGAGWIPYSSIISVGSGATFDVSGVGVFSQGSPPYTMFFGQTLSGSGGTGTIKGDLTLDASAALALTYAAGTPTLTVTSNLVLNGNAAAVNSVNPLFNGTYKLISKSGSGLVSGTVPVLSSGTVGGAGIGGGGTPSLSISGGELILTVSGGVAALEWGSGNGTWAVGTTGWGSGGSTAWANTYAALFTDTYSTGSPIITLNTEVLPKGVIVSSTKSYTINGTGDIGGTNDLVKLGTGILTLDVANAHTGGTKLFAGTLNLKKAAALGAASGTFSINGGTLDNTSGGALTTLNYPQAWSGNFTFAGSSDLNLGTGAVSLGGTRTVTVSANTLTVGGAISGSGFGLVKAGAGALALNGVLGTDAGAVTVNAGTLRLSGNNTFTGGVTINEGEVILNNAGALNSTTPNTVTMTDKTVGDVTTSMILSLNGNSVTVANLTKNGFYGAPLVRNNHASTPMTLTVDVAGGTSAYVGAVADGGAAALALTKTGSGTWQFGAGGIGSGTYSGDTTISGGTLFLGAAVLPYGAGKGNLIIAGGATLDTHGEGTVIVNGLSGGGLVTHSSNANASDLRIGENGANGNFSGVIQNGAAISPFVGVTKLGAGTQILSGINTYTRATTVNAGTLLVNSPGSLAADSAVTVNSSATLGGDGTINGSVTVNAGGSIAAGASLGTLTLASDLDLSAGGTNVWELAALKDNTDGIAGTDFDQIAVGTSLTLGGSSTLKILFTGTATAPDAGNPFWQSARSWTVISAPGAASNFAAIENGVYPAGSFTTSVQAGVGIVLTFTPGTASPTPVTSFSIARTGSDLTLGYSGGSGSRFVLLQTNNVAAPLVNWTRLKTNAATPGSFAITPGSDPQEFYRVKSE